MAEAFLDKLAAAVRRNDSRLCVGLDPDPARIPDGDVAGFNRRVIEATADLVCCYKPNIAFYEALGQAGYAALRDTLAAVPDGVPVLLDAKRGDVDSTAEAYARAVFDVLGADAVTVSPYLGGDALAPFLRRSDRGIFVLCRTSNPGAVELQDLPVATEGGSSRPLYLVVAERARSWNGGGNVGLVVGATYPAQLARVRAACTTMPILVPGVGTQGGALAESVQAADNGTATGFLINASRSITYAAGPGATIAACAAAARAAAATLRDAINAALQVAT